MNVSRCSFLVLLVSSCAVQVVPWNTLLRMTTTPARELGHLLRTRAEGQLLPLVALKVTLNLKMGVVVVFGREQRLHWGVPVAILQSPLLLIG